MSTDFAPRRAPVNGSVVLMLGILSIFGIPLLGPFAWHFGNQALAAIKAGTMDPNERGTATAGRACGIVGSIFLTIGVVVGIAYLIFFMAVIRPMALKMQDDLMKDTPVITTTTSSKPAPLKRPKARHGDGEH